MKKRLLIIVFSLISFFIQAQALSGEKIAVQLDSICKADKLDLVSVFFHVVSRPITPNQLSVSQELKEHTKKFQFKGQFVIVEDEDGLIGYYNLEKLLHFTIRKQERRLNLYFQVL